MPMLNVAINPHHGLNGFHILCVSDPMLFYAVNVLSVIADTMNTQVHDTTKQIPYELVFGQEGNFCSRCQLLGTA